MLRPKRWLSKLANLYAETDGRRNIRIPADFKASISGPFGTHEVTGVDANRFGAGVLSPLPLDKGALVFLRMSTLGLVGFAHVRHCSKRGVGYLLGLEFREALARDRDDSYGWSRVQIPHHAVRSWDEADVS